MKRTSLLGSGIAMSLLAGLGTLGGVTSPLERARRNLPLSARKSIAQHRTDMDKAAQKRERKRLRALELQARLDAKHGTTTS